MPDSNDGCASAHLEHDAWRTSTFSGVHECVALAVDGEDGVKVRNSNDPEAGTLHLSRDQFAGWVAAIKAGTFNDLA